MRWLRRRRGRKEGFFRQHLLKRWPSQARSRQQIKTSVTSPIFFEICCRRRRLFIFVVVLFLQGTTFLEQDEERTIFDTRKKKFFFLACCSDSVANFWLEVLLFFRLRGGGTGFYCADCQTLALNNPSSFSSSFRGLSSFQKHSLLHLCFLQSGPEKGLHFPLAFLRLRLIVLLVIIFVGPFYSLSLLKEEQQQGQKCFFDAANDCLFGKRKNTQEENWFVVVFFHFVFVSFCCCGRHISESVRLSSSVWSTFWHAWNL